MFTKIKNSIFFRYTMCFAVVMLFICIIFLKNHMSFIWTQADGLNQHYITLNFFKNILNNFIKSQRLDTFTWNIGFGMDMFANLAYYSFGDIFSYVCLIVPVKYLKYLYCVLVPVRLYLTGISFLLYCKYHKKNGTGVIIGSLMYTFCAFSLFASVRHPYFVNAMIVFPISMIGIEKFICENKKILYIFSVFLMFFCSFYFGYMNALVIAIYGIILCFNTYKKDYRKIFKKLFLALIYALVGLMMCSFIIVPTIYQFINSSRVDVMGDMSYSIDYYRNLLAGITTVNSASNWSVVEISAISLFTLPIFIRNRKKNYPIFLMMIILILPLLFSNFSYIISGLSYPNNRYVYMLMFIFSYISVLVLDKEVVVYIKDYLIMLIIYLLLLIIYETGTNFSFLSSLVVILTIILVFLSKDKFQHKGNNYVLEVVNIIVIISIMFNAYYFYDVHYGNYISEFMEFYNLDWSYNSVNSKIPHFYRALDDIQSTDKEFYKIAKDADDLWNLGLLKNYNSINYFYSINSGLYKELSDDLGNRENSVNFEIKEFDNREKITSLLGVKYFVSSNDKINLYDYHNIKDYGDTYAYQNNHSVNFASLYTQCINTLDYDKLNFLEREDALLKYYISDNCRNQDIKLGKINNIAYSTKKKIQNKLVLDYESSNTITLKPRDRVTGELYVKIDHISYKDFSLDDKAAFESNREIEKERYKAVNKWNDDDEGFTVTAKTDYKEKFQQIYDDNYIYYNGNDNILINLGYYDNYDGSVKLKFSKKGIYEFDNLELYVVSMDDYTNDIDKLNQSNFKLKDYGNNYISGTVDIYEDGVLNFQTLYNKGWSLKIDGKKSKIFKNKYFLATNIKKGKHTIELEYSTPYFKEGVILSIIGCVIYGIFILKSKLRRNM